MEHWDSYSGHLIPDCMCFTLILISWRELTSLLAEAWICKQLQKRAIKSKIEAVTLEHRDQFSKIRCTGCQERVHRVDNTEASPKHTLYH